MQVRDDDRVDVDVVDEAPQLGEHAVAAVEQQAGAVLLDRGSRCRRRPASCQDGDLPSTVMRTLVDPSATLCVLGLYPLTSFETAADRVRRRCSSAGALLSGLARRSFLSLTAVFVLAGFVLGDGGLEVLDFDPRSGFVQRPRDRRADRDPVPRRARGRGRDAPARVAPAAAQARARRCRSPRVIVALAANALIGLRWTESFLRRRAALPHRPGALLQRGDQPARAADRPPLAQPRVRAQRRARAAGRARLHGGAGGRAATSCGGSSCCRT